MSRHFKRLASLRWLAIAAGAVLGTAAPVRSDDASPEGPASLPAIDPDGIPGALVIVGGGRLPGRIEQRFFDLAGGAKGRLIVVPTAAENADALAASETYRDAWKRYDFASIELLHTRDRTVADSPEFCEPLARATAVWFDGGSQSRLAEAYVGTRFETELQTLRRRGGVVGGTSAGAAVMSRVMIRQNNPVPEMGTGLDLLPCSIIDQHYTERNRRPRLLRAVTDHPGCFGLGIDESTAAVVRGRLIEVVGEGTVSVVQREVPPEARPPVPAERTFRAGEILDLVSLARGARDRARWARADSDGGVAVPQAVGVEQGSLVIVGGGRLPREVAQRFVELAGGADAKIVVLPTADVSGVEPGPREGAFLERLGAGKVTVLPGRTREKVESAESLAALNEATGIWFGGGRQWRFVDCYEGTQAVAAFHACLRRGGVIGGSSAGATIQGEYLVRGHPLGNLVMMAEGYERGFAFLPGTAIDQHVFQRMRFSDMSAVVERHPQYLGIGIDEGTALIVRGEMGEVWGDGYVHFYDARRAAVPGEADYLSLQAGERFDLRARRPTQ